MLTLFFHTKKSQPAVGALAVQLRPFTVANFLLVVFMVLTGKSTSTMTPGSYEYNFMYKLL